MIQARNLTKHYGKVVALEDVSFDIARGEVVGFLGPNGAGKTTTMKILTTYLPATKGTASVADLDVAGRPLEVRRRIGYLPETNPLYPEMRVREYLKFIQRVREVPARDRKARMDRVAAACGLGDVMTRTVGHLSKGFRQRVGLAQAMMHDPDVLILDEPTSGLDPRQIIEIRDLIRRLGTEKTVILSTHILPEVEASCHRVMIVSRGRLVGQGATDDLRNRAESRSLLYASIQGPEGEVLAGLRGIPEATDVRPLERDGAWGRYEVATKSGADPGEAVYRLVRRKDWGLRELHFRRATLEDIFLQLTQ